MLSNMQTEIKRETQAVRSGLLKQRRTLSRERKFSPVRASRTRATSPIQSTSTASETRQAQRHCSTRRRVVYDWLASLSASAGNIQRLPREQRGTTTEFRLSNLHPVIRIFVSGTTLAASVHYRGRCWDVLKHFEALPKPIAHGWINLVSAPGRQRVYSNVDALWNAEVFDRFRDWFELVLGAADTVMLSATPDGTTWAELMPFATPHGVDEMARFPVWAAHIRTQARACQGSACNETPLVDAEP